MVGDEPAARDDAFASRIDRGPATAASRRPEILGPAPERRAESGNSGHSLGRAEPQCDGTAVCDNLALLSI
jgi:hypothetical protein